MVIMSIALPSARVHALLRRCSAGIAVALLATIANAAPQLAISPLGYQITQIQPVPGNRRAYDVTSRAGVVNSGDPAVDVTARLTSSHPNVVVLDGDVRFGSVPRTSPHRPVISQDTFSLRIALPRIMSWSELVAFVRSVHGALVWQVSCANCGATNRPPLANAGADQTAYVQQLVTLDGSASSDPDGDPLSYAWSIVGRPPGSIAALNGATSVNPAFTPDREGAYTIQLTVSDGQLTSSPDSVVVSTLNSAPVANAGPDQTAVVGQAVQLDGSGSSDVDGDALTYAWAVIERPSGSTAEVEDPALVNARFTPDVPGRYGIELVVDDGTVSSASDTMTISTVNSRPVADAGPDQAVRVGETTVLDGSGSSDADRDPLSFRWSLNSRPPDSTTALTGADTTNPSLPVDRAGTYVAQLIVNDGTSDSDADTVSISTINSPPVAVPGPDQTLHFGATVQLNGAASSDADGDALGFTWALLAVPEGSTAALSDANIVAPTFVADRPGTYVVQLIVNDGTVSSAPASLTVTAQNEPPVARDDAATTQSGTAVTIAVLANDTDADGDTLRVVSVTQPANGTVTLTPTNVTYTPAADFDGTDSFTYTISDGADTATAAVAVTVSAAGPNAAPTADAGADQSGTAGDTFVLDGRGSRDPEGAALSYRWTIVAGPGGAQLLNATAAIARLVTAAPGIYGVALVVNDGTLDSEVDEARITALPADPTTIAPPVPVGETTTLGAATQFLYEGANAIQTGVVPGAIEESRAAVLRGRVISREGQPLSAVLVNILGQSQYGRTLTRADGRFDLVVNGGGALIVDFQRSGYLPAQRQVQPRWGEFEPIEDVALVALDAAATPIDLTQPNAIQTARGNTVTDADGTRRATLLFKPSTAATLVFADGRTQPISSLTVRATEYTVGANGERAMPAALPPTSGYTYAVELSVDEAIAAGAIDVRFDRPVAFYVENFVGMPVGTIVPVGSYDRRLGAWRAEPDGRVIAVLSQVAGVAEVDIDGDGVADTDAALMSLGIDEAERRQLAALYPPGATLARASVTHFTPYDLNYPWGAGPDVAFPRQPRPAPQVVQSPADQNRRCGSIILCESQALAHEIEVAGTPYRLHYSSDRVPGRFEDYLLRIPVSEGLTALPPLIRRMEVEVRIAGRLLATTFQPALGLTWEALWDGRDVYGRPLNGEQPYTVKVTYVYPALYFQPRPGQFSFNFALPGTATPVPARGEWELSQTYFGRLGATQSMAVTALGGWTLSEHHSYDVDAQTLHRGDGVTQRATTVGRVVRTIADFSTVTSSSNAVLDLDVGSDGSAYFVDAGFCRVRRRWPSGEITVVAGGERQGGGTGLCGGYNGDGIPATQANLSAAALAVGPDGSVYIADFDSMRIRRIGLDGIITTIAGNGVNATTGDGGPATVASVSVGRRGLVVAPDGTIYFNSGNDGTRIRRIGPDGIIHTFAGTGVRANTGDGGPASDAAIMVENLALGPDGSLYFLQHIGQCCSSARGVRRIGLDGIVQTIAGGNTSPSFGGVGDGGPATAAAFNSLHDLAVGPDGSVYLTDRDFGRIRQIGPEGIINTIGGGASGATVQTEAFTGDGLQATRSELYPHWIGVAPDGAIIVVSEGFGSRERLFIHRIRRLALPSAAGTNELIVARDDASELYVFSRTGRHLRTLNALTGAITREFTYDTAGRLESIVERTGGIDNVTTITRLASGEPLDIIAPFGQRTALQFDANGYLRSIVDPAGVGVEIESSPLGLLDLVRTPRAEGGYFEHRFAYDGTGRLIRDEAPDGGVITLSRTRTLTSSTIAFQTAEGRTTTYLTAVLPNGDVRQVTTNPDGSQSTLLRLANGTLQHTAADGTVEVVRQSPDPRWGWTAPYDETRETRLPSGLTRTVTRSRQMTLTNPEDLFALGTLRESIRVNGVEERSTYDSTTRTLSFVSPSGRTTTSYLDSLGRTFRQLSPGVAPIELLYDDRGRLTDILEGAPGSQRGTTLTYASDGFIESILEPLGRTTRFVRDAAGRVVRQQRPDSEFIEFAYDGNSNLRSLVPPGRAAHTFQHDGLDLLREYRAPGQLPVRFEYDQDRQVTLMDRAAGNVVSYQYDSAGRLSLVTSNRTTSVLRDSSGRPARVTSGGVVSTYSYNGELIVAETQGLANDVTLERRFDLNFRVAGRSLDGLGELTQSYDADNALIAAGALQITRDVQTGNPVATQLESIATAQAFNAFSELVSSSAGAFYFANYTRDDSGRIIGSDETIDGETISRGFRYDSLGRLVEVTDPDTELETVIESYGYDANGNRVATSVRGQDVGATYDAEDRVVTYGSVGYTHTADGERVSRSSGSEAIGYGYDALGGLTSVSLSDGTVIGYQLDEKNRRVAKQRNGTTVQRFVYQDSLRPIAEYDGDGALVSRFVYADDVNVPAYLIRDGVAYRLITDVRGSVRLVMRASDGAIVQRMDYDSFGVVLGDTNPGFQPFGFAGGLYDDDTSLVHFGARDYDPETGRWLSRDPILFDGDDTNLYAYVGNDPINRIDPSGLAERQLPTFDEIRSDVKDAQKVVKEAKRLNQGKTPKATGDGEYKELTKNSEKTATESSESFLDKLKKSFKNAFCGN